MSALHPGTEALALALALANGISPANDIHRVLRPEFIRMIRQVHACGPRAVGELLMEVADREALELRLPTYAGLDPDLVAALGARDFPDPLLTRVR